MVGNNLILSCFWPPWSREYYRKSITSCRWAFCDGNTLKYNRNCGKDGACSHSDTDDCNRYDGNSNYPQCWLTTGGGPLESSSCVPGEEPTIDGDIYDYGCVEKGSSARCEKIGGPIAITCEKNPAGCDSNSFSIKIS